MCHRASRGKSPAGKCPKLLEEFRICPNLIRLVGPASVNVSAEIIRYVRIQLQINRKHILALTESLNQTALLYQIREEKRFSA